MLANELKTYKTLENEFGKDEAFIIMNYFDAIVEKQFSNVLITGDIKEEFSLLSSDIKKWKTDMIKWMFVFWAGQLAATIAIVKLFL